MSKAQSTGEAMTYTDRYRHLIADRAHARRVAHLRALLAPYTLRAPAIPAQRRRVVRTEVAV